MWLTTEGDIACARRGLRYLVVDAALASAADDIQQVFRDKRAGKAVHTG
jgi:hypothetical protein